MNVLKGSFVTLNICKIKSPWGEVHANTTPIDSSKEFELQKFEFCILSCPKNVSASSITCLSNVVGAARILIC